MVFLSEQPHLPNQVSTATPAETAKDVAVISLEAGMSRFTISNLDMSTLQVDAATGKPIFPSHPGPRYTSRSTLDGDKRPVISNSRRCGKSFVGEESPRMGTSSIVRELGKPSTSADSPPQRVPTPPWILKKTYDEDEDPGCTYNLSWLSYDSSDEEARSEPTTRFYKVEGLSSGPEVSPAKRSLPLSCTAEPTELSSLERLDGATIDDSHQTELVPRPGRLVSRPGSSDGAPQNN
ncbi:hypothetical protein FRC14_000104 [Serendipita sp. 396]|nr:hypothetical protein FRC14_000104 [Serendipita sp. 396]KAG8816972.1 hypothetical protein FRC19_011677 [Serendipita sp. 401]KAG8879515.1 hypothetical protein FRC20_000087 [Serendipita sp. 405]